MPVSKKRDRVCQHCGTPYVLGLESTLHKYCSIKCRAAWHYNRWKSSGGKRDKKKTREYWLKHKYNISVEQYNSLLEQQQYACVLCETTEPMGYNWHVDHCHSTGRVRGILCQQCNQGLGLFKEDKDTLRKAIEYLENFTD